MESEPVSTFQAFSFNVINTIDFSIELIQNKLSSDSQYDSLPARSCEVCHLAFLNLVTSLRNDQQSVVVIYFDPSKAFDKVPHRHLLVKLEALGIRPPLLDFIGSYLSNPSQKVLLASPTLDNLDTFLRFCNPDDGLQVQLMIKAGSDGFACLIGEQCSQQGRISMMVS
ncbi:unnamed protein product [Schistocephalus solidus]|uniref:Reverse transcriptase domain-containing protein n=1 Tax=Schistocephalus solidus TaxID=70667 RepID=A0A183SGK9_SCHSO|nr:unnamed protein product [Schistocephalus solidus]